MNVAHLCLLFACVLPIACAGIAKSGRFGIPVREGGYDNRDPRSWLARQTGFRARANAAQANSFEALPPFIAGVLVAQQRGAAVGLVDALAVAFILVRVLYIALYLRDLHGPRSLAWMLGFALCVALFFVGA